jgi:hypothetical protein
VAKPISARTVATPPAHAADAFADKSLTVRLLPLPAPKRGERTVLAWVRTFRSGGVMRVERVRAMVWATRPLGAAEEGR